MGADANLRFLFSPFLSGIVEQAITQLVRDFRAGACEISYSAIPERKDGLLGLDGLLLLDYYYYYY